MPESPDVDQVAAFRAEVERILAPAINARAPYAKVMLDTIVEVFAEQLRQVWNARGAADAKAIERLGVGTTSMQGSIYQELKALDR
jgi:hypothetical protein